MKQYNIIFAVIAMREAVFFANVADRLKKKGYKTAFVTFYEPGDEYLIQRGYDVYSIHKEIRDKTISISEESIKKYQQEYQLNNIRDLLIHEKVTFNCHDEEKLLRKTVLYFNFFSEVFTRIKTDIVVQELGGFIAPLTLFYSCLKLKVNHFFLEPAMYKGRLFLTHNQINCDIASGEIIGDKVSDYVRCYIEEYNNNMTVVAPEKDLHHFKDATLSKLINKDNVKKLINKIKNKYVKSLDEEYSAIGNYVLRFAKMYFNRRLIGKFYTEMNPDDRYIYYPFHVPLDFQLTVRSNQYLDQISLIQFIANILPYGVKLYIKEHPAAIGAYTYKEISKLLINENVKLIHPFVNSYDLIAKSESVITINSKVGVEALYQRKKVIVLGEAFYRGHGLTIDVNDIKELNSIFKDEVISCDKNAPPESKLMKFFEKVYQNSFSGELYVNDESNLANFSISLANILNEKGES